MHYFLRTLFVLMLLTGIASARPGTKKARRYLSAHKESKLPAPTPPHELTGIQKQAIKRVYELCAANIQSEYFKNVDPDTFQAQLIDRIANPYALNQGKTFFCWAAAPLAFVFDKDPVAMAEAVVNLYSNGKFLYDNGKRFIRIKPSEKMRNAIGSETFNGPCDLLKGRVVDQMVLMTFAEHYKCMFNTDRCYHPNDQMKPAWAGATLRKAAKVWKDLRFDVDQRGYDLFWMKKNKSVLVAKALKDKKTVILYINAPYFNQEFHKVDSMCRRFPYLLTGTHYILIMKLVIKNNDCIIDFWDDDGIQENYIVPDKVFQRSVFGMLAVSKPTESPLQ